jgi:phosphate uptake regulator
METRKIQTTKSGSFFITLPKSWVEKKGLMNSKDEEKSKELTILEDEEGNLIVGPLKSRESSINEFNIPIEEYIEESSLERCINSSYVQGADIISIFSESTIAVDKKRLVKDTVINLIGTEIAEEFSNRITIRVLVDPIKFPLVILIKRIYNLVHSMHLDAIKSFKDTDQVLAEDVVNREKEVDKLYFLMLRQLNLSLSNRLKFSDICPSEVKIDCVLGIVLARDLSKMAHYGAEIAKESLKLVGKKVSADLKSHLKDMSSFVIKMQQNAILAFFKNDFMRANKVLNDIQKVRQFDYDTEHSVLEKSEDTSVIISIITISRNLRNIATSAVAVSEDLQAKYRPRDTHKKEATPEIVPGAEDLIASLYEKEDK